MGEKKNKWGVLCNYVTGKQNNSEIVNNVITERINDKVKSLEDVQISIKKNWKKKHKVSRMFRNNANMNAADAMKTYDFSKKSRWFSDPKAEQTIDHTNLGSVSYFCRIDIYGLVIMSKNLFPKIPCL